MIARQVHIHPHSSVEDICSEDALGSELEYKQYTWHDAASKGLPLKLFECQPVVRGQKKRPLITKKHPF